MALNEVPIRIAVDAMGGDYAPVEIVAGAVQAAREENTQVILVGESDRIKKELVKHEILELPIATVPSEGVIGEGESPALALRQKPKASILVATGMVRNGLADACVSMGSTGATMAAAATVLGVIEGIDRPALGGPVIGLAPHTVVIDLGTNVDCRPSQLLSYGVIGEVFARIFWNVEKPRVGILSVGAEVGKGNRQVREASELFTKSGLNFVGNVEANDLLQSKVEVAVCDGFVGNIVMKLTEGLGRSISEHIRVRLQDRVDPSELDQLTQEVYELNNVVESFGGGPLFGVKGVSVVGHGRARAEAVQRAIALARESVESGLVDKINDELARMRTNLEE